MPWRLPLFLKGTWIGGSKDCGKPEQTKKGIRLDELKYCCDVACYRVDCGGAGRGCGRHDAPVPGFSKEGVFVDVPRGGYRAGM